MFHMQQWTRLEEQLTILQEETDIWDILMTLAKNSFRNIKVGLDCSNGSASAIAKSVFDALGAETYVINNEPNGTNINMECRFNTY